jgi:hypothetical protein
VVGGAVIVAALGRSARTQAARITTKTTLMRKMMLRMEAL